MSKIKHQVMQTVLQQESTHLSPLMPEPSLRTGTWLTPKNMTFPTCYCAKFGHSGSNCMSVITDIRRKDLTPHVPPYMVTKLTGTNTDQSASGDFLLPIHSNHGHIQDKR